MAAPPITWWDIPRTPESSIGHLWTNNHVSGRYPPADPERRLVPGTTSRLKPRRLRMRRSRSPRHWLRYTPIVVALAAIVWQAGVVVADGPPRPNPLAPSSDPRFAPVPGADITKNGPAASVHGDPLNGRRLFALNCVTCHNDRGVGGLPNPGSDDGTVPPLNPMPEFLDASEGNPAAFARDLDLFVQHGSRPSGDNPQVSMIGW